MKRIFGDTFKVFLSNFIQLLSGILVGFILPKIMGINDYGFYKIFTLYTSYTGLFQIGFLDGIVLKYGGYNYDQIDKRKFSGYFRVYLAIQIGFCILISIVAVSFIPNEYRWIFAFLSIYLLIMNIMAFFQMISRITLRFGELAVRNILQAIMTIIVIGGLFVLYKKNDILIKYYIYIISILVIYGILAGWYIYTYRDIVFCRIYKNKKLFWKCFDFMKMGTPIMIAYLCSTLILTLDRQFVSVLFDTETFSVYAFAYTMLSLITTALTAVSTVIYPNMKRVDEKILTQKYTNLVGSFLVIAFAGLLVYYPLDSFINWFLPRYSSSLIIFRIVLPGVLISSVITIIMQNYYVALNEGKQFFSKTLIALVLAFFTNCIAYVCFHSTIAISVASVVVTIIWYIISESYFVRKYGAKWKRNFIYLLLLISSFYISLEIDNKIVGFSVYLGIYILISVILFHGQMRKLLLKNKSN